MLIPIGKKDSFTKTITELDVYLYSNIVGDLNPLHTDEQRAKESIFGDTVTATVKVREILNAAKGIYGMDTTVINKDGIIVVEGYAIVMNTNFSEQKIKE